MDNHYHLLVSPIDDDMKNISLFMKKLNMGYAKFFNEKYERSGYLWQGKYKKILIEHDSQFNYIPYYLHLNPVDYINYDWRNGQIDHSNIIDVLEQLQNYRWSSFLDYNNIKNFPSVTYPNLLSGILGDKQTQEKQIRHIVSGNKSGKTTAGTDRNSHSGNIDKLEK